MSIAHLLYMYHNITIRTPIETIDFDTLRINHFNVLMMNLDGGNFYLKMQAGQLN